MKLFGFTTINSADDTGTHTQLFTDRSKRDEAVYTTYCDTFDSLKENGELEKEGRKYVDANGNSKLNKQQYFKDDQQSIDLCDYHIQFVKFEQDIDVDHTIPQEETAEFVGEIIDIFDDFLDDKQIVLPNKERDEADVEDCCNANIYGSDYDTIADKLEALLNNWRIFK